MQPLKKQAEGGPWVCSSHLAKECLQALPLKQLHEPFTLQACAHVAYMAP